MEAFLQVWKLQKRSWFSPFLSEIPSSSPEWVASHRKWPSSPVPTMGFLLGKLGALDKGIPPVDGMKGVVVDNGSNRVCLSISMLNFQWVKIEFDHFFERKGMEMWGRACPVCSVSFWLWCFIIEIHQEGSNKIRCCMVSQHGLSWIDWFTPQKTNMTMEKHPFEDASPI